jgi:hypothetical protein
MMFLGVYRQGPRRLTTVRVAFLLAWWLASGVTSLSTVQADEASGTWSGELEGRGNYFLEKSTRVMIPTGRLAVESPGGVRVHADYLVDIITSASIATGTKQDSVFTELRHGIGAGIGKTFGMGEHEFELAVHGVYSTESDYKSWLFGLRSGFAWNEKNSSVSLGVTGVSDRIYSTSDPLFHGQLQGLTTSVGFSQVLSPRLVLSLGYQFVLLDGYLGNPYRSTQNEGQATLREHPPEERRRHNVEAQLAWYIAATRTTLQVYGRYYTDSWDLRAFSPELRVYQELGRYWNLRVRFRYYDQGDVYFAPPAGGSKYPAGYAGPTTKDPKLLAFQSQQLGVRLSFSLLGLEDTFLDFASRVVLDVSFDRQWCTSSFGNNIFGTLGGRLPF